MPTAISTPNAPAAVGPYSQAVSTGDDAGAQVFISGQIPLVPATGQLVEGDIQAQARQSLTNIGEILKAAGLSFADVVKPPCCWRTSTTLWRLTRCMPSSSPVRSCLRAQLSAWQHCPRGPAWRLRPSRFAPDQRTFGGCRVSRRRRSYPQTLNGPVD